MCALAAAFRGRHRLGRLHSCHFVTERRSTVGDVYRQIRALAASVSARELAIEVSGISRILIQSRSQLP